MVSMGAADLDDATTELYALAPAAFTKRRTELVAQARKGGLPDVAKAIADLRRPTVAAWLVNQLARGEQGAGDDVEQLELVGTQLRLAQAQLDGPRMKELTQQRQKVVAALIRRATDLVSGGGQNLSTAVQRELEETFGAAVADEQASLAVTSGRLTRALAYSGFGEVDVTAATATPLGPRRPAQRSDELSSRRKAAGTGTGTGAKASTRPDSAESRTDAESSINAEGRAADREQLAEQARQERIAAAAEALEQAKSDLSLAMDELGASSQRRDEAHAEEERLSARLEELQREILQARHELDAMSRRVASADREHQRGERQVRDAEKVARRAEHALERLDSGD